MVGLPVLKKRMGSENREENKGKRFNFPGFLLIFTEHIHIMQPFY
jgi:hypothetical protein